MTWTLSAPDTEVAPKATPTLPAPDTEVAPKATSTPPASDTEVAPKATPTPETVLITAPFSSLVSSRLSVLDYVDHPPPIASLITIGAPGPDGVTPVTGAPGSVPPLVYVMVATVEYGNAVTVSSAADGGFSASVITAPGATIQVRYNPYFSALNSDPPPQTLANWPGTLMGVAHSPMGAAVRPSRVPALSVGPVLGGMRASFGQWLGR